MDKRLPSVLMFLLVVLTVLGAAEADCSCSSTSCDCRNLGLTSVPQDLPTTITDVDFRHNQITTISQSDFSRYRGLERLDLSLNRISTINSQAFHFLSSVAALWLYDNRLTILRADMFEGLVNLEQLHLYRNDITDIQAGTFSPTRQLAWLALHDNRLTTLRADMFTGEENLRALFLPNNEISDIQDGTFTSTPQLRNLYMYNNMLTSLRSDMFTGLENLERLELYSNVINDIQSDTFNPTPQLTHLYLYKNHIQSIPSNLLANLVQLTDLYLSDNLLTMFPFDDLSKIQAISTIALDNNQMTTLPSMAYEMLSTISHVNISINPWQCDCRMVDFRLTMTGSYSFEHQITCSQPDNLNGQQLIDINTENLLSDCVEPIIVRFERGDNIILYLGDTLHLVCEASGIPTPDITVILPSGLNATVQSDGRVTVDMDGNIVITNATAVDAGLYTCIAASPAGSTSTRLSIDVIYEEPTILRFESFANTLLEGEIFLFVCEASGIPVPDITAILPSGLNATVESVGRVTVGVNGTIVVRNATKADAGLYVCIAESPAGSAFAILVVDLQTVPTTVSMPSVTSPLIATFSLPVLFGAICGSIAGTLSIVAIILTIWCKRRNNNSPLERPDNSVIFNNSNTTAVITRFHSLKEQTRPHSTPNPSVASMPAEYETVKPCPEKPRHRSADPMVAFGRTNESNYYNERPPVPLPRTTANVNDDSLHQYQSLRKTDTESVDDYETPHDYVTLDEESYT